MMSQLAELLDFFALVMLPPWLRPPGDFAGRWVGPKTPTTAVPTAPAAAANGRIPLAASRQGASACGGAHPLVFRPFGPSAPGRGSAPPPRRTPGWDGPHSATQSPLA